MTAESKEGGTLPIGAIAALVLLAAGVFVKHQSPLESSRPGGPESRTERYRDIQDLDARLWEDPFAALARLKKQEGSAQPAPGADHDIGVLVRRLKTETDVQVLGVMVFGGPYIDDAESRRRTRYAVLAGLDASGYAPESSDRIGFFRNNRDAQLPEFVPFEFFESEKSGDARKILLLWLDEDAFGTAYPMANLDMLFDQLGASGAKLQFGVIGPAGSTALKALIAERQPECEGKALRKNTTIFGKRKVEFYSPSATAIPADLLPKSLPCIASMSSADMLEALFADTRTSVLRAINTDEDVLKAVVAELGLRGVKPGVPPKWMGDPDQVVLISEWDTDYGRQLPTRFIEAACESLDEAARKTCKGEDGRDPKWVTRVSYMRGLDGGSASGSARRASKETSSKDDKSKESGGSETPIERAEGSSQFDYLRRLAATVEERTVGPGKRKDVKAVGVLGSDLYDKLLVFRALRPQFPKAIFFTTDLDARLVHPDEYEWTRNALVGSGYGLELNAGVQGRAPPFRDVYQTAAFIAARLALDASKPKDKQQMLKRWLDAPRVYEIGRTQAFALQPGHAQRGAAASPEDACAVLSSCPDIHPPLPFFFAEIGKGLAVAAGVAIGTLVGLSALYHLLRIYVWTFRDASDRALEWLRRHRRARVFCAGAILFAVAVALCVPFNVHGEPFAWAEGVSIWPTDLIRLVALALSLYFIGRTLQPVELEPGKPEGDFFSVAMAGAAKSRKAPDCARIYDWYLRYRDGREKVEAAQVWYEFRALERPTVRFDRLWLPFLLYMVFAVCLMLAFRDVPNVPYRGALAFWTDKAVLLSAASSFLVLLFLVLDVIRLSSTMIRNLSAGRSVYPEDTLKTLRAELNYTEETDGPLCELLDIRLIAAYTEHVNRLVYYPFVVLALMVVARSSVFDNWYMPPVLALTFLFAFLVTVLCAMVLQQLATRARGIALGRMTEYLTQARGAPEERRGYLAQLEMMLDEIRHLRRGAFLPLLQQPLVKAILVPLGSFGGLQLFEFSLLKLYS